jgi:ATP phosphoribosyltransferase
MNKERVERLLKELRQELDAAEVDVETQSLASALDADIQALLASKKSPTDTLLKQAKAVEVRFAVEHPMAERILRELVDTLARIGV